ncbi:ATP-dependent helicase HrpB [Desulfovibrio sp. An276]|uniref:ATP-dependent helicase HrpB n=1 Tax=Desulfovibrio sp. An276 TaxID=1965618 RepID=UPI000B374B2C|nr:ATP-dependent helicase HrpB [Desulfovibrio sp. An276]OUO53240.1 ATP-dependent helicase HrpB [Desulfovibrio sp. An276]
MPLPDFSTLPPLPPLPIDSLHNDIACALQKPAFLLQAPPGTGKSTRVPLWALEETNGRVLLLEPRRVAARMLASHLAGLCRTSLGELVGLAMRNETRVSAKTRLLVVTEGVLTRMLCADPALENVSCVLFDEFHERHLASDTGLALTLRCQEILRPDLKVGILSATLDIRALQALLPDAPVLLAERPGYPVETRYQPVPGTTPGERIARMPAHMAAVLANLAKVEQGSILAFLPGQGEIARVAESLEGRLPYGVDLWPLYGRLALKDQQAALAPCAPGRRKIVLATDVAETSLTIEGVRVVVDSGLQRRPEYDTRRGAQRLVTHQIPLSSAEQRRGRAGRTEPGVCVRLWVQASEEGMASYARPEILEADLAGLALDLALWGENPSDLPFVTQPPSGAFRAAQGLLQSLGALDTRGSITDEGRLMAGTGLAPRVAATLHVCKDEDMPAAALLCALLEEDQGRYEGDVAGLLERLSRSRGSSVFSLAGLMLARARRACGKGNAAEERPDFARALRALLAHPLEAGRLLLPGWADRLALVKAREQGLTRALTRQGTGVVVQGAQVGSRFFLALETSLSDTARGQAFGRVSLFCPVDEESVFSHPATVLSRERVVRVQENGAAMVSETVRLDALVLEERRVDPREEDKDALCDALCAFVLERDLACLPWDRETESLLQRTSFLARVKGEPWPNLSREELKTRSQEWLPKLCSSVTDLRTLKSGDLLASIRGLLPWQCLAEIEKLAPVNWVSPCGKKHPIRYDEENPCVEVKLQECFGLTTSPCVAGDSVLTLHLLSPSGVRLASTRDLPFFWKDVYPKVRSEMRGRYPRHPWPEDPLTALPTTLTQKGLRARNLI